MRAFTHPKMYNAYIMSQHFFTATLEPDVRTATVKHLLLISDLPILRNFESWQEQTKTVEELSSILAAKTDAKKRASRAWDRLVSLRAAKERQPAVRPSDVAPAGSKDATPVPTLEVSEEDTFAEILGADAAVTIGYLVPKNGVDHPIRHLSPQLLAKDWISTTVSVSLKTPFIQPKHLNAILAHYVRDSTWAAIDQYSSKADRVCALSPPSLEGTLDMTISIGQEAFTYGTHPCDDGFVDFGQNTVSQGTNMKRLANKGEMRAFVLSVLHCKEGLLEESMENTYWNQPSQSYYSQPDEPKMPRELAAPPGKAKSDARVTAQRKRKGKGKQNEEVALSDEPAAGPSSVAVIQAEVGSMDSESPGVLPFNNNLKHLLEYCRPKADLPAVTPPSTKVSTKLLPYQKRALAWMLEKERPASERNTDALLAGWVAIDIREGPGASDEKAIELSKKKMKQPESRPVTRFYMDEVSGVLSLRRFVQRPLESGGLLADQMGLGKTVEMLSLIAANPRHPHYVHSSRSWRIAEDLPEEERPLLSSATLIIVPQSIAEQWMTEIGKHWKGNSARILKMNAATIPWTAKDDRLRLRELCGAVVDLDIVVVTYEHLVSELNKTQKAGYLGAKGARSPLLEVLWWRVVIDEAQEIGHSTGRAAHACNELFRENGWLTTGTPITSGVSDLHGLLVFLDHDPLASPRHFQALVEAPFEAGQEQGIYRMRSLLSKVMWRNNMEHVKEELSLPTNEVIWLDLEMTGLERTLYNKAWTEARQQLIKSIRKSQMPSISLLTNLRQVSLSCFSDQHAFSH